MTTPTSPPQAETPLTDAHVETDPEYLEPISADILESLVTQSAPPRLDFGSSVYRALLELRRHRSTPSPSGWLPIKDAKCDGRKALVYRPLARKTGDEPVAVKRLIGGNNHCWPATVPEGCKPTNPTDGACHVTLYQPLLEPPK